MWRQMKSSCWESAWPSPGSLQSSFIRKGSHSEDTVAAASGSCPPSSLSMAELFCHRKKKSWKFGCIGTIFALGILKLQMFPNFLMVWLTTFWLDDGMKEISLQQRLYINSWIRIFFPLGWWYVLQSHFLLSGGSENHLSVRHVPEGKQLTL